MLLSALSATVLLVPSALGAVVWDGRFNDYSTAADFDKWSWSNQVGTYQTYIYGNLHVCVPFSHKTAVTEDLLTRARKLHPGIPSGRTTGEKQGVKVKITGNSVWNGGTMLRLVFLCELSNCYLLCDYRSELIPQTTASLSGHLYYHVSLQIPTVNPPDPNYEHQIVFWEGHYADIKYGQLSGQNGVADVLRVITGGKTIWSVTPVKGTWYNFILETGSPGGLWVSTGSSPLTKVYSGSLNGNGGTDWHVGILRLPNGNTNTITEENIYYSGVYVENSGPTTTP
ncbi:hypothetical protein FS749_009555 [Ceratobasidium sp. UAMH 11750]|nr:hypothetical protein FS749_009555 [Ceratobasidium sp. UAMH 11750]